MQNKSEHVYIEGLNHAEKMYHLWQSLYKPELYEGLITDCGLRLEVYYWWLFPFSFFNGPGLLSATVFLWMIWFGFGVCMLLAEGIN